MTESVEPTLVVNLASRGDTRRLGYRLGSILAAGDLVVLEGDLGAGKTFLVRAVARSLGVPTSIRITSPTFDLIHELPGRFPLIHADFYRLTDPREVEDLGLADRIGGDALTMVEWGDRFARELGGEGLWIHISLDDAGARTCRLQGRGPRGRALMAKARHIVEGAEQS